MAVVLDGLERDQKIMIRSLARDKIGFDQRVTTDFEAQLDHVVFFAQSAGIQSMTVPPLSA